MSLSDEQRVRYARHLLLPELGEVGQLKLLAGSVRFAEGVAEGAKDVAGEYLRRAGVRVIGDGDVHEDEDGHEDVHAHGDVHVRGVLVELACDPALRHAADALSGAFAAVEAIKQLAVIGKPGVLDRGLLRAEEV